MTRDIANLDDGADGIDDENETRIESGADGTSAGGDSGQATGDGVSRRTLVKTAGAGLGGLALGSAFGTAGAVPTPRLHTDGKWIRDPAGNEVELRGMAIADPGFYRRFHSKSFQEVLAWATDEDRGWHPNVVRLPLTKDSVDHFGLETYVTEIVRPAVDYLRARDVYALVDFHLIRPYTQAATDTYNSNNDDTLDPIDDVMTTFWDRVAPEFADDEHVVYELFNEPTQPSMYGDDAGAWQTWRDAAQPWVDLVRSHAPDTPIIVGSPRYTSVTHMAPQYPFDGDDLIYAAHIYPANGAPSNFDQYYGQPAEDVPVVVTEFGWDPSGGSVDQGTTSGWGQPFRDWVAGYANMGWISWCFDDSWAPTFFDSPGSGANEPWTLRDGTDQMGGYVKTWLSETQTDSIPESNIDDARAPPTPSNLTITRVSEVTAEIAWDPVTDVGPAGLTNYDVYVDGSLDQQVVNGTAATSSGLEPNSSYEIGVSAVDAVNNASSQATVVVETVATDAQQSAYVDHAIPGTIQAEDFDTGGQGIAYYDTTEANQGGASYRQTAVDVGTSTASGYNVGYVSAGEWLEYTVDVETAGTYELFVTAASGASSGGTVRLELDRTAIGTHQIWNTGGWSSYEQMRVGTADLPAGEHVVRIYAETAGWNLDSVSFDLQSGSGDTTAPTTPSNLAVTDTSSTSATVSWGAASDSGGSGLDHYDVYVDGSLDQQVPAGTTSVSVAELAAGTSYEIAVAAVDNAGNASSQASTTATTDSGGDTTAPTTPDNLAVSGTSTSSVTVGWGASTDSGTGVDHYAVSVDGGQNGTVAAGTTSATVSDLSADTSYQIGVAAVDGAGNQSATATIAATTDADDGGTGDALVVNDYDGSPAWSSNQNDLGQWCGAGSFQNGGGEVVTGALELDYDNGGWFQEQLNRDVSNYSTLILSVSGASGGEESEVLFDMGGVRTLLANVTSDSVGTSTTDVSVDLATAGVDRTSSSLSLRLNFWQGGSSTLSIEEIRLE